MEALMHGSFNKSGETVKSIYRNWGVGIFALPILAAAFVVGLAVVRPDVPKWISDAVQAELVSSDKLLELAPRQIAKPSMEIRTVRAD
jgi:hypothetical protein